MPPGWHWCRSVKRLVAPGLDEHGKPARIAVPVLRDAAVGTPQEQAALAEYEGWKLAQGQSGLDRALERYRVEQLKEREK